MAEKFLLEREKQEVEVEGRTFRLEEMSGATLREYIRLQVEQGERAIADILEAGLDQETSAESILKAVDAVTASAEPFYLWMLRNPVDGGPPADAEFLQTLSPKMKRALVRRQDELNDVEGLVGNGLDLLAQARARRVATMALAGPS